MFIFTIVQLRQISICSLELNGIEFYYMEKIATTKKYTHSDHVHHAVFIINIIVIQYKYMYAKINKIVYIQSK